MIRVLEVHSAFNWGGVENWLIQVLPYFDKSRFRLEFFASHVEPFYAERMASLDAPLLRAPDPRNYCQYLRRLWGVLDERGPYDIVHSHFGDHNGAVLWTAHRAGVPARISHSHNDFDVWRHEVGSARRAYFLAGRLLVRRYATCGLAASARAAASYYGPNWSADQRWKVLPCGIDLQPFRAPGDRAAVRAELGIPADAFVVVNVGRFVPQKNHVFALEIARAAAAQDRCLFFLFIGDGPLRAEIRQRCVECGLAGRSLFLASRTDVPRLLRFAADAFLFPSLYEGLGIALVEAQAAALPCVISDLVPEEADIIPPLIHRLSLAQPAAVWASELLAVKKRCRPLSDVEALHALEPSPFNVRNSAHRLQSIYEHVAALA